MQKELTVRFRRGSILSQVLFLIHLALPMQKTNVRYGLRTKVERESPSQWWIIRQFRTVVAGLVPEIRAFCQ